MRHVRPCPLLEGGRLTTRLNSYVQPSSRRVRQRVNRDSPEHAKAHGNDLKTDEVCNRLDKPGRRAPLADPNQPPILQPAKYLDNS
jgi:hypothetical protein